MSNEIFPEFRFPDHLELLTRHVGSLASEGILRADEFSTHLDGLDRFLWICEEAIIFGRGINTYKFARHTSRLTIAPPNRGSWEAVALWIVGTWATGTLAPLVPKVNRRVAGWFLKHTRELWNQFVEWRTKSSDARHIAAQLQEFLYQASGAMITDEQSLTMVYQLDDALRDTLEPLSRSATETDVSVSGSTLIHATPVDRDVLHDPLPAEADEPLADPDLVSIRFIRLNVLTGIGLIQIEGQPGRQRHCQIVDDRVMKPGNPYALALTDQNWVRVWCQEMKPILAGRHKYFRVFDIEPNGEPDAIPSPSPLPAPPPRAPAP